MPITFLLVICILFILVCVFILIQKNRDEREFQELMNYDSGKDRASEVSKGEEMGAGIYSARGALRKAAILKEEGQITEAVTEIKKVQEMQADRDKLYFTSFKKLIEDNIQDQKFLAASKFLDKYENMLGTSTEKQYTLVSYVPFKELYLLKRDVAIGLKDGMSALQFSLTSDWFNFHEQYERPINVLNFAYAEFITYIKQLDGGIISKQYLPKLSTYLATGMPAALDPVDFLDLDRLESIISAFKLDASIESIRNFSQIAFYYPIDDFKKSFESLISSGRISEWKTGMRMGVQQTGNEVQETIKYALQTVPQRNIYAVSGRIEDGKILYENSKNQLVDCKDITIQFFEQYHLKGKNVSYNLFPVLYVLLYWDVIHTAGDPDKPGSKQGESDTGIPRDFYRSGFFERNEELFAEREAELYEVDLTEEFVRCIADHREKPWPLTPKLVWDKIDIDTLGHIVRGMDKTKLLNFIHLLANEFRLNRALPDLYLWPDNDGEGKFIEVKHAEEPFTENELFWILNIQHNIQIPIEIVTVRIGA